MEKSLKFCIFLSILSTVVILHMTLKYKSEAEQSEKTLLNLIERSNVIKGINTRKLESINNRKLETVEELPIEETERVPDLNQYVNGKRLPNALIIGEMKGGTTALSAFLGSHPNISMAPKEVNFFDLHYEEGFDWYREKMSPSTENQTVMEKSVYFGSTLEPCARIKKYKPDIKMLLILRDPITRAISQFSMRSKNEKFFKTRNFEDFILQHDTGNINKYSDFISRGMYYQSMKNWMKCFKISDIHIVDGDNFKKNPLQELKKVEKYMGFRPYYSEANIYYSKENRAFCYVENGDKKCLPSWVSRSHRNISSNTLRKLHEFYYPLNKKFMNLVQREFSWKMKFKDS